MYIVAWLHRIKSVCVRVSLFVLFFCIVQFDFDFDFVSFFVFVFFVTFTSGYVWTIFLSPSVAGPTASSAI